MCNPESPLKVPAFNDDTLLPESFLIREMDVKREGSKCHRRESFKRNVSLRVRTFSSKTFRVYHVYCNAMLCYMCRITVSFGTLKDRSLLIDNLYQTIVLATGASSIMASTLCQN